MLQEYRRGWGWGWGGGGVVGWLPKFRRPVAGRGGGGGPAQFGHIRTD